MVGLFFCLSPAVQLRATEFSSAGFYGEDMPRQDKISMTCSAAELPGLLRAVADSLDHGRISLEGLDAHWDGMQKLSLTIRNKDGMAELKIKVARRDSDAASPAADKREKARPALENRGSQPGYSVLKKRMKKTFKNIMYALHNNIWPEARDVDSFVRDSVRMVGHQGKGDEFYAEYTAAVADFEAAVRSGNLALATEKAYLINDLKTRCHKHYD